jgi:UDP-N-acetylmuramoyl-tripeptide--D-alanyl-D-alanine ligase
LQVIGEHFVDNALAAAACAFAAGASMQAVIYGLQSYAGENGRMQLMNPFFSEQKATLINDAYNANPGSVRAAIEYLAQQKQPCKILVLGDMGELGTGEAAEHTAIGFYAAEKGINVLITVGRLSALAAEAFSDTSDGKIFALESLEEALPIVGKYLQHSAVILLKGSRSSGVDRLISMINDNKKVLSAC